MSAEAAAVARRAAEIVQERGHCKREMTTKDGQLCLHGAIREAASETVGSLTVTEQINAALRQVVPFDATAYNVDLDGGPDNWPLYYNLFPGAREVNDRPDTDDADVAKVLLQVADRLDVTP